MPDTTREDDESGFIGLTVVLARMNEANPNPPMTAPATATLTEKSVRAGSSRPECRYGPCGEPHECSHEETKRERGDLQFKNVHGVCSEA